MPTLLWHEWLAVASFFAAIAGLGLLIFSASDPELDVEATDRTLMMMVFSYWMVHCVAIGLQKLSLPDWEVLTLSLQFTAISSYLLTFSCVISLPLKRLSVRSVE
jgi:hypothetical protein